MALVSARADWRKAYRMARLSTWADLRARASVRTMRFGPEALRAYDAQHPAPVALLAVSAMALATRWLRQVIA